LDSLTFVDATKVKFWFIKGMKLNCFKLQNRPKITSSGKFCYAPHTLLIHSHIPTNGPHKSYISPLKLNSLKLNSTRLCHVAIHTLKELSSKMLPHVHDPWTHICTNHML